MGLAFGQKSIYGVSTVQNKIVADFKSIHTIDANNASKYEIAKLVNQIVEALLDKSATNINYIEEVDCEKASTYEIAHALNRILLFLKAQDL